MLIEEMMNKRDLATKVAIIIQNKVGKDTCGIYNIEDFENMELSDFMNYLSDQMNTYKYHNLVFNGWVFTKDIFHKMEDFILMAFNNQYQVIWIPEMIMFIVSDSKESNKNILHNLTEEMIKISSINMKDFHETNNAVEFTYNSHVSVKYFEEKPKSVENIIKEE